MKATLTVSLLASLATARISQDAAMVDPEHHKVEFENDRIRVIPATYPLDDTRLGVEGEDAESRSP